MNNSLRTAMGGNAALLEACAGGLVAVVRLLFESNVVSIKCRDPISGRTPLHVAAET